MSEDKVVITYITNEVTDQDGIEVGQRLMSDHPIQFNRLKTVQEAFPLLSDPNYYTDFFTIDVELIFHNGFTDVFSLINTLKTLIDSTVCRDKNGKIRPRKTKILGIVGMKTDLRLIKQINKMDAISGLTLRVEPGITYDNLSDSCGRIIEGDFSMPKKIQDRFKNKKVKSDPEDDIRLTPRQQQILLLISQRGASNKVIAKTLNITESTVKLHVGAILKKYGVRNRTQLAVFSREKTP